MVYVTDVVIDDGLSDALSDSLQFPAIRFSFSALLSRALQWFVDVGLPFSSSRTSSINQHNQALHTAPTPGYYVSYLQMPAPYMTLIVRSTTTDVASLAMPVRSVINEVDKEAHIWDVREMDERVALSVAPQRFTMLLLLGLFALIALMLAASGILSVMSFTVAQRTHEIGIRMALGAQKRDIFRLIIGQGMLLTLIGTGVGLISAFALTRLMSSLLFGVGATDPATFVTIVLILIVVSLLACYIPARRATQVDPMIALRYE